MIAPARKMLISVLLTQELTASIGGKVVPGYNHFAARIEPSAHSLASKASTQKVDDDDLEKTLDRVQEVDSILQEQMDSGMLNKPKAVSFMSQSGTNLFLNPPTKQELKALLGGKVDNNQLATRMEPSAHSLASKASTQKAGDDDLEKTLDRVQEVDSILQEQMDSGMLNKPKAVSFVSQSGTNLFLNPPTKQELKALLGGKVDNSQLATRIDPSTHSFARKSSTKKVDDVDMEETFNMVQEVDTMMQEQMESGILNRPKAASFVSQTGTNLFLDSPTKQELKAIISGNVSPKHHQSFFQVGSKNVEDDLHQMSPAPADRKLDEASASAQEHSKASSDEEVADMETIWDNMEKNAEVAEQAMPFTPESLARKRAAESRNAVSFVAMSSNRTRQQSSDAGVASQENKEFAEEEVADMEKIWDSLVETVRDNMEKNAEVAEQAIPFTPARLSRKRAAEAHKSVSFLSVSSNSSINSSRKQLLNQMLLGLRNMSHELDVAEARLNQHTKSVSKKLAALASEDEEPAAAPAKEEKPVEEPAKEEKPAEEPAKEEKPTEEPPKEEKPTEEPDTEEKAAEEIAKEENPTEEPANQDKPAEELANEEKPAEELANNEEKKDKEQDEAEAAETAVEEIGEVVGVASKPPVAAIQPYGQVDNHDESYDLIKDHGDSELVDLLQEFSVKAGKAEDGMMPLNGERHNQLVSMNKTTSGNFLFPLPQKAFSFLAVSSSTAQQSKDEEGDDLDEFDEMMEEFTRNAANATSEIAMLDKEHTKRLANTNATANLPIMVKTVASRKIAETHQIWDDVSSIREVLKSRSHAPTSAVSFLSISDEPASEQTETSDQLQEKVESTTGDLRLVAEEAEALEQIIGNQVKDAASKLQANVDEAEQLIGGGAPAIASFLSVSKSSRNSSSAVGSDGHKLLRQTVQQADVIMEKLRSVLQMLEPKSTVSSQPVSTEFFSLNDSTTREQATAHVDGKAFSAFHARTLEEQLKRVDDKLKQSVHEIKSRLKTIREQTNHEVIKLLDTAANGEELMELTEQPDDVSALSFLNISDSLSKSNDLPGVPDDVHQQLRDSLHRVDLMIKELRKLIAYLDPVIANDYHSFLKAFGQPHERHSKMTFAEPLHTTGGRARESYFKDSSAAVEAHNQRVPRPSWTAAVNKFSDLSAEELRAHFGYKRLAADQGTHMSLASTSVMKESAMLEYVDWRSRVSSLHRVHDQGECGSCWAYAAVGALEAYLELSVNKTMHLLPDQLVQCVANPHRCGGSGGCMGATASLAFEYVRTNGLQAGPSYDIWNSICSHQVQDNTVVRSRGLVQLPVNQALPLMQALQHGPVAVSVAGSDWFPYQSGIFDSCPHNVVVDHAVLALGYGKDGKDGATPGLKYWLLRNSWGAGWGEGGFIRLLRHDDYEGYCGEDSDPLAGTGCIGGPPKVTVCGMCGILSDSSYPVGVHVVDPLPILRGSAVDSQSEAQGSERKAFLAARQ